MIPRPNHPIVSLFFLVLVGFSVATVSMAYGTETDRSATLEAIHALENPRNVTRPGPCGELGAYQFREATWRTYTGRPFADALNRGISDAVAVRHYEWLKLRLEQAHLPATTYNIALAWNGGIRAAITGRASRSARDYAERAANLAAVLERTSTVADVR
ncbi:MAG TPA: hypothetical protein VHE61_07010 [Opitutaceae bacterium]|nr:hypothetical protein [Opitutaceae bacterium]